MSHPRVKSQEEVEQEAQNILQRTMRGIGDGFGAVDDAYMGFMRDQVLRLPQEGVAAKGSFLSGPRNAAGSMLFQARTGAEGVNPNYQYRNLNGDSEFAAKSAMFGNRALHAGGLTAAGAGLVQLTGAVMNQFGGPADQPTERQLYM